MAALASLLPLSKVKEKYSGYERRHLVLVVAGHSNPESVWWVEPQCQVPAHLTPVLVTLLGSSHWPYSQ